MAAKLQTPAPLMTINLRKKLVLTFAWSLAVLKNIGSCKVYVKLKEFQN